MTKKKAIALIILTALSLTACVNDKKYQLDEENDAVAAAQELSYEKKESECRAENYQMDLVLDTSENTVSGVSKIEVTNQSDSALDEVCFRYFAPELTDESEIRSVKNTESGEEYAFTTEVNDTFIRIPLEVDAIEKSETLVLEIDFISYIPELEDRFGFTSVNNNKIYNMCFCFPQVAFLDNGEWADDEYVAAGESTYNEMTDYYVSFTAPEDYVVLSSGKSVTENGVTSIEAENVREMAITACNFAEVETKEVNGIAYNILKPAFDCSNKEYLDDLYTLTLECAIESVEMFSENVGAYIYDELDIIPTPFGGNTGGMEMPGLVQISIPTTLDSSIFENYEDYHLELFIHVVSHEVAHQWFYCAVGNDQYNEPWLDESFASYLEYDYCRNTKTALEIYDEMACKYFDIEKGLVCMETDYYRNDERLCINYPVNEYPEDAYEYVYSFGEVFLTDLEKEMGREAFFEMMSDWYELNKNGIAEGYMFVQHVVKYESSEEVKEIINDFISQKCLE